MATYIFPFCPREGQESENPKGHLVDMDNLYLYYRGGNRESENTKGHLDDMDKLLHQAGKTTLDLYLSSLPKGKFGT